MEENEKLVEERSSDSGRASSPTPIQGPEEAHALVKKKWTQAERLLVTPLICSAQWPEALASSTSPCIGRG